MTRDEAPKRFLLKMRWFRARFRFPISARCFLGYGENPLKKAVFFYLQVSFLCFGDMLLSQNLTFRVFYNSASRYKYTFHAR